VSKLVAAVPSSIKFLDLWSQHEPIWDELQAAIARVVQHSQFIGGEDHVAFEKEFATYQTAAHCVGVANGTDAIEIILEALDLPARSEVIVPANSFIATSEAVTRVGHRVVFADADPETYTIDPVDVERRITSQTAAIIAVHLHGQPCTMDRLTAMARSAGLHIVEDCAQAHGAEFRGRRVGTFGVAGSFSFFPGKNLGAFGDAGAIVSNDSELATRCRMIANHGRVAKYDHMFEGRNSRLDNLQAAVLRVKLKHLDRWTEQRNAVAREYATRLSGVGDLILPRAAADTRHAFHLYVVRTASRDALAAFLRERGIDTGIHYPISLPRLRAYAYLQQDDTPFSNSAADQLLSLPMGHHLNADAVQTVADAITEFFAGVAA
jgi:dTDP-4-amino-4,6-dideoxygalactose transaminase